MVIEEHILDRKVETLTVAKNQSVRLLVLVRKNFSFDGVKRVCDINCYGKTILQWAMSSAGEFTCKSIEYGLSDNVVDIIKPHLGMEQITIALFAETPLIRHATLVELVNDFIYKGQKVRKFKRGYIFDTEFVKSAENVYAPEIGQEESEDFMPITNAFDIVNAMQILKRRILNYHISNGVVIYDTASTYIEAEVELEKGVIIYPNNNILGKTIIERGVVLYPNNVIKDSYICQNSVLKGAFIESVKVQAGTTVEPNAVIAPKK